MSGNEPTTLMRGLNGPAEVNYISICRALQLAHEYVTGDWYVDSYHGDRLLVVTPMDRKTRGEIWSRLTWLPTLSDWHQMLEEVGITEVTIHGMTGFQYVAVDGAVDDNGDPIGSSAVGLSREEAAARLWLTVTEPRITATARHHATTHKGKQT